MRIAGKIKISFRKISGATYFLLVLLIIFVLYFDVIFLYNNFYESVTQSEIVLVLKNEVATETFDINKFNGIIKKINQKTYIRNIDGLNNPFH